MHCQVVSLLTRNDYHIETDPRKVGLYYTAIVSIICLPLLTHEEVKSRTNRPDQAISTVTRVTRVCTISDILRMFGSVHYFGIDPTRDEPRIYHCEVVVAISWIATMMIESLATREYLIPVVSGTIEACIIAIWSESL